MQQQQQNKYDALTRRTKLLTRFTQSLRQGLDDHYFGTRKHARELMTVRYTKIDARDFKEEEKEEEEEELNKLRAYVYLHVGENGQRSQPLKSIFPVLTAEQQQQAIRRPVLIAAVTLQTMEPDDKLIQTFELNEGEVLSYFDIQIPGFDFDRPHPQLRDVGEALYKGLQHFVKPFASRVIALLGQQPLFVPASVLERGYVQDSEETQYTVDVSHHPQTLLHYVQEAIQDIDWVQELGLEIKVQGIEGSPEDAAQICGELGNGASGARDPNVFRLEPVDFVTTDTCTLVFREGQDDEWGLLSVIGINRDEGEEGSDAIKDVLNEQDIRTTIAGISFLCTLRRHPVNPDIALTPLFGRMMDGIFQTFKQETKARHVVAQTPGLSRPNRQFLLSFLNAKGKRRPGVEAKQRFTIVDAEFEQAFVETERLNTLALSYRLQRPLEDKKQVLVELVNAESGKVEHVFKAKRAPGMFHLAIRASLPSNDSEAKRVLAERLRGAELSMQLIEPSKPPQQEGEQKDEQKDERRTTVRNWAIRAEERSKYPFRVYVSPYKVDAQRPRHGRVREDPRQYVSLKLLTDRLYGAMSFGTSAQLQLKPIGQYMWKRAYRGAYLRYCVRKECAALSPSPSPSPSLPPSPPSPSLPPSPSPSPIAQRLRSRSSRSSPSSRSSSSKKKPLAKPTRRSRRLLQLQKLQQKSRK